MPISYGWAAGDVSLAAYIQACLARKESQSDHVSALGAVMVFHPSLNLFFPHLSNRDQPQAFLYSTYIILYAILSPTLGKYVDNVFKEKKDVHPALINIAGVQFTILSAILLLATLIPKGALSINPQLLFGEDLHGEVDGDKTNRTHDSGSVDISMPVEDVTSIPVEESFLERPPIDHKHRSEKEHERASERKGYAKQ